jgi:hypothetical protein
MEDGKRDEQFQQSNVPEDGTFKSAVLQSTERMKSNFREED